MIIIILLLLVPLSLSQDPCSSSNPNQYSSWMGDLYNKTINSQTWGSRRLNEILLGGSHDAGMWKVVSKVSWGVFYSDNTYITQSRDLIGQLCSGARWFDIRLSYFGGQWVVYHAASNSKLMAYGVNVDVIISQVLQFLSFPKYSREVIFWRIKIGSGDSNQIANYLRSQLSSVIVDRGNRNLSSLTLNEIWEQRTVGNLVIMEYEWNSPLVSGQNQTLFWDYTESQWGASTDATDLPNMLALCTNGQFPRLLEYKAEANQTGLEHPLIGLWWTFSTGNIQDNTNTQWRNDPTGLNDFYKLNNGEIGNILLVDFFGDQSDVMKITWDYNNNKYGISPPLPPDFNYSIKSTLPGSGMISGDPTCIPVNPVYATNSIAVIVCLVVLVVILGLCFGGYRWMEWYNNPKIQEIRIGSDAYVEMTV